MEGGDTIAAGNEEDWGLGIGDWGSGIRYSGLGTGDPLLSLRIYLFMISILYAFIFCWVLIITDLITGEDKPPVKLTFIITSILFIIGTLIVGIFNPATPELIYHATNDTLNSTNMTEVWV